MIDVNFQNIDTLPEGHHFKGIYKEATKKIRELSSKYVIDWDPSRGRDHLPDDPVSSRGIEFPSMESIPTTETYYSPQGDYSVTYYKNSRPLKGEGKQYSKKSWNFIGKMVLDPKKDIDLLFFLLVVTKWRPDVEELKEWQNPSKAVTPIFTLVDMKKRAEDAVGLEEQIFRAKARIFGDNRISDSMLSAVASSMEIPNVHEKSIPEIQNALNMLLFTRDKNNQYKFELINQFLVMTQDKGKKNLDELELKRMIQEAKDKKIIVTAKANAKDKVVGGWYWSDKGKPTELLCPVPVGKSLFEVLAKYLQDNPIVLDTLKSALA